MGRMSHGGDIYRHPNVMDFSSNCNPLGPPPAVVEAIREAASGISCYPDTMCEALRAGIASGLDADPEDLFIGNGAAEVIFALAAAARPSRALLPAPTFSEYEAALTAAGCACEYFDTEAASGYVLTEGLLDRIRPGIDILFLCNPNNPTGTLCERAYLQRVLARCEACGARLVVDECFLDFASRPEERTLLGEVRDHPSLVILKAFTKLYAMAGVRLGYGLCSDRELLSRLNACVQPWNVSSLAQAAGLAALEQEAYVKDSLELIRREKAWLAAALERAGLPPLPSEGNYLFFHGPEALYGALLERGFLIRDCSSYRGLGPGDYRISVRLHSENEKLMEAMEEVLI